MRSLNTRHPVGKHRYVVVSSNPATHITTSAWLEIIPVLSAPISGLMILNTTGKVIKMSVGLAGLENESEVKFFILPSTQPQVFPFDGIKKGARISVQAVDSNATADSQLVFNLFG